MTIRPVVEVIQLGEVRVVEVRVPGGQGDKGDKGDKGDPGEGLGDHLAAANPHPQYAQGFVFTQSTPSAQWTVNHNLGYRPAVAVFDSGSQEIDAEVTHLSGNTAVIAFATPTAGFSRLI